MLYLSPQEQDTFDMLLKPLFYAAASLLLLGSCDEAPAAKTTQPAAKPATPVQETAAAAAPDFVNGITEANSGSATGPIHLHGKLDRALPTKMVYLYRMEGKDTYALDSANIENNLWDFGTTDYPVGLYTLALGPNEKNVATIVLNPSEKDVELGIRGSQLASGLYAVNSAENTAWLAYAKTELSTTNGIRSLKRQMGQSSLKSKFKEQISLKERELIGTQHAVIQANPGTFVAKLLTWKQSPYKTDKSRYWDDIDWTDESIIRTPVIPDRIQEYMRAFSGGTDTGFMNSIDLLAGKASPNPQVKQFVLFTLLEGFYSSKKDNMCLYILEDYIYGDSCGDTDLDEVMRKKAQGVANLQLGKQPPGFSLAGHDGKNVDLYQTAQQSKYTLLMFWSSWCHKCEQEIPVLKNVYNSYNSKGFEVIGVSLDMDRNDWLGAINERQIPWAQVCEFAQYEGPIAKDYRINATPTLYLLDNNLNIVLKPERIHEVQAFLQQNI